MKNASLLFLVAFVLGAMAPMPFNRHANCAGNLPLPDDSEGDVRKKIAEATSGKELGTALNQLFKNADAKKLAKSADDTNLTIAMRACWEMVAKSPLKPDTKAQTLLEDFEKRVSVPVPEVWKEELRNLFLVQQSGFSASSKLKGGFAFGVDREYRANSFAGAVTTAQLAIKLDLDKSRLADLQGRYPFFREVKVAFSKSNERSFVVFFCDWEQPYPLLCVDSKSGNMLWEQPVWGTGTIGPGSGQHVNYLAIACDSQQVAIFGKGSLGLSIEVFSTEDGKPQLRFATTNWFARAEP